MGESCGFLSLRELQHRMAGGQSLPKGCLPCQPFSVPATWGPIGDRHLAGSWVTAAGVSSAPSRIPVLSRIRARRCFALPMHWGSDPEGSPAGGQGLRTAERTASGPAPCGPASESRGEPQETRGRASAEAGSLATQRGSLPAFLTDAGPPQRCACSALQPGSDTEAGDPHENRALRSLFKGSRGPDSAHPRVDGGRALPLGVVASVPETNGGGLLQTVCAAPSMGNDLCLAGVSLPKLFVGHGFARVGLSSHGQTEGPHACQASGAPTNEVSLPSSIR